MSLKVQLVYPLPDPTISLDPKFWNGKSHTSEPEEKYSQSCDTNIVYDGKVGHYVCTKGTCESCDNAVKEKLLEKRLLEARNGKSILE